MVRLPVFLLLLLAAFVLPAQAQIQPRALQTIDEPEGEFSLSLRFSGKAQVSFRNVGTLVPTASFGDHLSEVSRVYGDGYVLRDTRTTTSGGDLPDDGYSNTWRYNFASQQVDEDGDGTVDGIGFHRYETRSDGATIDTESSMHLGIDMDYAYTFGTFGGRLRNKSPRFTWGGIAGLSIANINAEEKASFQTTLLTMEDRYTLDGAAVPDFPYTAPSSESVTSVDSDGNEVTNSVDTTILLGNRPYSRTYSEEAGAANIIGYWQVRGGTFTGRLGTWARWRLNERLSLRASVGVSAAYIGLKMRYDERLDEDLHDISSELRETRSMQAEKYSAFGYFGSLDAEFWLTGSTALFGSATYDRMDKDIEMTLGGRTADIRLSGGSGFRLGITKLF